ncbi:hypothetical protein PENTCL1PPCAC_19727, partial [Pristionchus entomophagus]
IKVALKYKRLSSETKLDLELAFCIRNGLRWLNSDMSGDFDKITDLFSEVVGLNVEELLTESDYFSHISMSEVKNRFKKRADEINLPAQEYVDLCAKSQSVMNINKDEKADFNKGNAHFMGKEWGKTIYNSSEELVDVLFTENAPFTRFVTKRWNFMKLHLH